MGGIITIANWLCQTSQFLQKAMKTWIVLLLIAGIVTEKEFVKGGKEKIAVGGVRMHLDILLPSEDKLHVVSVKEKARLSWMNKGDKKWIR